MRPDAEAALPDTVPNLNTVDEYRRTQGNGLDAQLCVQRLCAQRQGCHLADPNRHHGRLRSGAAPDQSLPRGKGSVAGDLVPVHPLVGQVAQGLRGAGLRRVAGESDARRHRTRGRQRISL